MFNYRVTEGRHTCSKRYSVERSDGQLWRDSSGRFYKWKNIAYCDTPKECQTEIYKDTLLPLDQSICCVFYEYV